MTGVVPTGNRSQGLLSYDELVSFQNEAFRIFVVKISSSSSDNATTSTATT